MKTSDATVVGGGIIGLSCAYHLALRGAHVRLIEADTIGAGASSTNAGWLVPSMAQPVPSPAALKSALRGLLGRNQTSPLKVTLRRPGREYYSFLGTLLLHCRPTSYCHGLGALATLSRDALAAYDAWLDDGITFPDHRTGTLRLFRSRRYYSGHVAEVVEDHAGAFQPAEILSSSEVASVSSELSASNIVGAIRYPNDRYVDPALLLSALKERCDALGVEFHIGEPAIGLTTSRGGLPTTRTHRGSYCSEALVLAAGTSTRSILKSIGETIPIWGGKGYGVDYQTSIGVSTPMYLAEDKVALTPLNGGLRAAGLMQFGSDHQAVESWGIEYLGGVLNRWFPELRFKMQRAWSGSRPMTPDGLPIIGPMAPGSKLYLATGHGMLGLTLAPITGSLMADGILGATKPFDLRFSPQRFHR